MSRTLWLRWVGAGGVALALAVALVGLPFSPEPTATAQPAKPELPNGLQYVPNDAAVFVYADVGKIWDSTILKDVRKADAKTFEFLLGEVKKELGLSPEDVRSVALFIPKFANPSDAERLAVVVTFHKAFDKKKLQAGAENLLGRGAKPAVVAVDAKTALVLVNLKEEDVKPQVGNAGPLTETIKLAASGKYAGVAGITMASLPDEIRGENLPAQLRPFQPLFKAVTVSATLDVEKNPTLEVKVRAGTAAQAVECEKSLGALLSLVQDEINNGLKEFDATKEPALKDVVTLLKAAGTAAKGAKFTTLGNETQLTVSMPADLPFGSAFVAIRQKIQEAAAAAQSSNNLKQIALAAINFADTNNSNLPAAAICDKKGKPLLSWRVTILPFIEQEALYKEFKLDEPWDSDHNKKLLAKMPKTYAISGKTPLGGTDTHYRVFVGNGAGYDWVRGARFPADFQDGTSNTLLCITAADAVPWTKPDELAFDPDKDMGKFFGNVASGRYQMALFDGSVRSFKKLPSKMTINALITRNGGEVIGEDFP